jgi:hypothetical protein
MRIKLLLLGLIALIAIAFIFEPAPDAKSKKRAAKQPLNASINSASKAEAKPISRIEPVVDRFEDFPPERDAPVERKSVQAGTLPSSLDSPKIDAWSARSWLPPPPKAVIQPIMPIQVVLQRSSAPTMPSLPYEFVGAMDAPAGGQIIFLRQGEMQHSVQVGETIDQQWRVEKLASDRIIFKYLPTNTDAFIARSQNTE